MKFQKGNPGRPKGTINDKDIKLKIRQFLEDIAIDDIPEFYHNLKPNEKASFIPKLMEFVIAKQREVKAEFVHHEIGEDETIIFKVPDSFKRPVEVDN